jgi:hypothetical protein
MNKGRLPNFLIIGAMKSGSTTLHGHLRRHPDVFLTAYKEPEFFVAEKNWSRGVEWYQRLFAEAGSALAVGESSTSYTKYTEFPGVPERIASLIPDVRLVYILREPVDRMVSMYHHQVLTGRESRPIDDALLTDPLYLGPSLYAANMRRYMGWFPRDQLHVMFTDDLAQDPGESVRRVSRFLGVDDGPTVEPSQEVLLRTSDRRADRRLKARLRGVAPLEIAFQRAPEPIKASLRRLTTREPSALAAAAILPETRQRLREKLADDLADLRTMLDSGLPAWGALDDS